MLHRCYEYNKKMLNISQGPPADWEQSKGSSKDLTVFAFTTLIERELNKASCSHVICSTLKVKKKDWPSSK